MELPGGQIVCVGRFDHPSDIAWMTEYQAGKPARSFYAEYEEWSRGKLIEVSPNDPRVLALGATAAEAAQSTTEIEPEHMLKTA